jgi:hypothetical protein
LAITRPHDVWGIDTTLNLSESQIWISTKAEVNRRPVRY